MEHIIRQLSEKFGKESPLTTARGRMLDYLVMTLDYMTKRKVKISMYDYIENCSLNSHQHEQVHEDASCVTPIQRKQRRDKIA